MDQDAEALVDRRCPRDAEDPGELVLQGAGQVQVEVGGREPQVLAALRQEGGQRRLRARVDQALPQAALTLVGQQVWIKGRALQLGQLLRRGDLAEQAVDRVDRLGVDLAAGPLGECGQLEQLQVAGDRPVEVVRRVEPRLDQLAAGPPRSLEHFVAHHPVGRVEILRRPEELLLVDLLDRSGGLEGVLLRPGAARARAFQVDPGKHDRLPGRCERRGDRRSFPVRPPVRDRACRHAASCLPARRPTAPPGPCRRSASAARRPARAPCRRARKRKR